MGARDIVSLFALFDDVDLGLAEGDAIVDGFELLPVFVDAISHAREDVVRHAREVL